MEWTDLQRLCLTGDTAVQNPSVTYRCCRLLVIPHGQTFRNASLPPIKLWPRWFPFATQFHEEMGCVGLGWAALWEMSCWPKPSPPNRSPLGCHGLVARREHSGRAWGDVWWAACSPCHWWGRVWARKAVEGTAQMPPGTGGGGRWWFPFLLPFPQQPVISAEPPSPRAVGSPPEVVPKRGFKGQHRCLMLICLKVTCKGKLDFSFPSQRSSCWMWMPDLPAAGLWRALDPAMWAGMSSSTVAVRGEPWLLLLHSRHCARDQARWQLRGMRRPSGGAMTTSVWRWAVRALGLQAAQLLANFEVGGMARKMAPAHLCNKVYPGTSGGGAEKVAARKPCVCACLPKPLSVPHLLEKPHTGVFLNSDQWEQYQSRGHCLLLLEHGRMSDGFELHLKWVSCGVLPLIPAPVREGADLPFPFLFVGAEILQHLPRVVSLSFACQISWVTFSMLRGMKTSEMTMQDRRRQLGSERWWILWKQAAQLPSPCRGKGAMLLDPRLARSSAVIPMTYMPDLSQRHYHGVILVRGG